MSRSETAATLLHAPDPTAPTVERGLVVVQIDGLPRQAASEAIAEGSMPALGRLIADEGYRLHSVYCGVPSSTPVAQAELFFGVPLAVPAYEFVERRTGRAVRMSQPDVAAEVERRFAGHRALLDGGGSYCNVYRGGASDARFCVSSLGWTDPFRTRHPFVLPALAVLYGGDLLRSAVVVLRELVATPGIFLGGLMRRQQVAAELGFAASHLTVAVAMRELIALFATLDIARGLPVVYLNLVGFDESAHRRGPGSRLARRALRDIDAVAGRMIAAAKRSERRAYDVWILSDHGQEPTVSYIERYGRAVGEAVIDVCRAHGIAAEPTPSSFARRLRVFGRHVVRSAAPEGDDVDAHWKPGRVAVTAQGPLGHVYAPRPLADHELDTIATALVHDARIPLVMAADARNRVRAWTAGGRWSLPEDAARILGDNHPFLAPVSRELVELCRHPDAGDLVISGWCLDAPLVTFPRENGSHGGPGPAETEAFALVPGDTPLAPAGAGPLRQSDVRRTALALLDGSAPSPRGAARSTSVGNRSPGALRVLTYNVHSCIGLDGRLSPARIAEVIAEHEPDVVALQELDVARHRTGGVDQAEEIAARLEMLLQFHPALSIGEERYGDAVLSRLPMRVVRAGALPRRAGAEPRGALWVEIDVGAARAQVLNTHLGLHPMERRVQVHALLGPDWLGAIAPGEAVLCGDFNALSWFPVCRRITRRLRDVQARPGSRPQATWQGGLGLGRIDHVFVDPAIEVAAVSVASGVQARVASDHLPLVVDLRLPNGGR
jgi:endonuclease/exonuclease/phosphatase family metal-dependent hydrolase